ncbi:MAG: NINE protein [Bacteroidetes bacterium]|nr:NINE protein [Bacteroidota bacterium]
MNAVEKEILLLPNMDGTERIFLHNVLGELNETEQITALQIYRAKRKDPQLILLLALLGLLGAAGVHRFILGQIGMGILYFLTAGFCFIGTIIDLINYRELALESNKQSAAEAAATVKIMRR